MIRGLVVIISLAVAQLSIAEQPSPTPTPSATPGRHGVVLYPVKDTDGHVAVVDGRAFATVDGLKRYIESLPTGDRVSWFWFHDPSPANPFTNGQHEIRAVCEKKGIHFHLYIE